MRPTAGDKHRIRSFSASTPEKSCLSAAAPSTAEKVIDKRINTTTMGFGAKLTESATGRRYAGGQVEPHDLVKSLIPELVGACRSSPRWEASTIRKLVRILTDPKNSLVKRTEASGEGRRKADLRRRSPRGDCRVAISRRQRAGPALHHGERSGGDHVPGPSITRLRPCHITRDAVLKLGEPVYTRDPARKPRQLKLTAPEQRRGRERKPSA